MADITIPLQALKAFADQADADLATAKTAEATATTGLANAAAARLKAEAQAALAHGTLDVMNGAQAVANGVTKMETDPDTKWWLLGGLAGLLALAGIGYVIVHVPH